MADFFRVQLGVVSRSDGHSAAKRAAYQSCGKIEDHQGKVFDFRRKAREHVAAFVLTPQFTPDWTRDPQRLWQRAAAAEKRTDAQEARIIDFSMPRAVPAELWETCIRYVYGPLIERGMILQIDIHDTAASDGARNVNVHGLATLRPIEDHGFSSKKDRSWNDLFRERNGRSVREQFAKRLTSFCAQHGIQYDGDARSNTERDLPAPEPQLPKWNFEAFGRTGEKSKALVQLHEHREKRKYWEAAKAEEIEAALELEQLHQTVRWQRQRRIVPAEKVHHSSRKDRRAAILRTWHGSGWIGAEGIAAIASIRYDTKRGYLWIDLNDGTTLIDKGDAVTMQGPVTWMAARETAQAAERHGWPIVRVSGDRAYKDAVTIACMLRGIVVSNHELSEKAQAKYDLLLAELDSHSMAPNEAAQLPTASAESVSPFSSKARSSDSIYREIAERYSMQEPPLLRMPDLLDASSAFKPPFGKPS